MAIWISNDFLSFFIALVLAAIIIPQILIIAFRKNLFDEVDDRKIHQGGVPRLGGIAFFPSILFSLALVVGINLKLFGPDINSVFYECTVPVYFMICAVLLMFLVGIADDLVGVRYVVKFIVQILSAILIVISGFYVDNLFGFIYLHNISGWFGWLVTIFAVVYVVNAINLIDGIDGLASGLSTVACVYYAIVFYNCGDYAFSMLACASAGTLLPFFYYNVFGNPGKQKKIFMGDAGALTTGMVLVFLAIAILHIDDNEFKMQYNPIVIALAPLIIPCFDVVRVYLHRVSRHRNPFLPDKSHIHHKLLALGLSQRGALCVILIWSLIFIFSNLYLSPFVNATWLITGDIAIWTVINIGLTKAIGKREKKIGEKIYN